MLRLLVGVILGFRFRVFRFLLCIPWLVRSINNHGTHGRRREPRKRKLRITRNEVHETRSEAEGGGNCMLTPSTPWAISYLTYISHTKYIVYALYSIEFLLEPARASRKYYPGQKDLWTHIGSNSASKKYCESANNLCTGWRVLPVSAIQLSGV